MSISGVFFNGYYDDHGVWVKQKHCFAPCPQAVCDCQGPYGYYSAAHDKTKTQKVDGK